MRKRVFFICFVLAIALIVFLLLFSDAIARRLWHQSGAASLALALNRTDSVLAMELGNYYFGGGAYELDKAEQAFQKALRINPREQWANYQLARVYLVKKRFDKALEVINKEIELHPQNGRAFYVRGLIYGFTFQWDRAQENFENFVAFAPQEWAGYNDLAWALAKQGKYEKIKEVIASAFTNVPDTEQNPWLWNSLGVAHLNLEEYGDAKEAFEEAKAFAAELTLEDWQRAYPGNDGTQAASGLEAFRVAIETNLQKSIEGVDNSSSRNL